MAAYKLLRSSDSKQTNSEASSSSDESLGDGLELRNHKRKQKPRSSDTFYVERNLEKTDTLQKLSLQYGLAVAELKRVNNLMTDQDFYALRSIKIPVKKYSHLEELLAAETASDNTVAGAYNNEIWESIDYPSSSNIDMHTIAGVETIKLDPERPKEHTDVIAGKDTANIKNFLQTMDSNLEKIKISLNGNSENRRLQNGLEPAEEEMHSLPASPLQSHWYGSIRHFVLLIFFPAAVMLLFVGVVVLLTRKFGDSSHREHSTADH